MLLSILLRAPRATLVGILIVLLLLATILTHAGVLMIGVLADALGISRFLAGLLIGILFLRLPQLREGRLETIGILPHAARRPVMFALLALGFAVFIARGDAAAALTVGFALAFLLAYQWIKRLLLARFAAAFRMPPPEPQGQARSDPNIIDVEFREKRD